MPDTPTRQKYPIIRLLQGLAVVAIFAATLFLVPQSVAAAPAAGAGAQGRTRPIDLKEAMKPWLGDLDGMLERRVIRVLTTYSKTFYFLDKATQRGVTFEAFRLFEQELNKQLAKEHKSKGKPPKVQVVFIPVARAELLRALAAGKGDVAANVTITSQRLKTVDFSTPVYAEVGELLVSGPASPAVNSADELSGKDVFIRKASGHQEGLLILNRRFLEEGRPIVRIRETPDSLEDEDLIEMVNAGLLPLTVVDKPKADLWKKVFPKIGVHDEIVLRTVGDVAWAFRQDSPQLKTALDSLLSSQSQGIKSGNEGLVRYLKGVGYVKDVASEKELKKFLGLSKHFKKYGEQYDIDWLLVAAQGYQESQLNQAKRGELGAVGVMQIMPDTGRELDVGDIAQIEPNIHAGVKRLRGMIDQHYEKEPLSRLDKMLFAFASQRADADQIAQLRKETESRGLNPNIWFQNVEYVAAETLGAETVTYVANIYKYYLAYRLISETRAEKLTAAETPKVL